MFQIRRWENKFFFLNGLILTVKSYYCFSSPGLGRGRNFSLNSITRASLLNQPEPVTVVWVVCMAVEWNWRHLTHCKEVYSISCQPLRVTNCQGEFFHKFEISEHSLCKKSWLQWKCIWAHIFFSFSVDMSLCLYLSCIFDHSFHLLKKSFFSLEIENLFLSGKHCQNFFFIWI